MAKSDETTRTEKAEIVRAEIWLRGQSRVGGRAGETVGSRAEPER